MSGLDQSIRFGRDDGEGSIPEIIDDSEDGRSRFMSGIRELYERFKVAELQLHRYDVLVTKVVEQDEGCQSLSKLLSDREST